MVEHPRDRPSDREVEVSLIGPGYGECVVIHLGSNRWMVVDSCLDKATGRAAALVHLESMGIDPGRHVDLVICTHWHDDHRAARSGWRGSARALRRSQALR